MNHQIKRWISLQVLRWLIPKLERDEEDLNRLLAQAVRLQGNSIRDDELRNKIDEYYRNLDPDQLQTLVAYTEKRKKLSAPGGYKIGVRRLTTDSDPGVLGRRFHAFGRRFSLLERIGVSLDVMILRSGETVPPHGHNRVVSGFYLVEGSVAAKHYDRIRHDGDVLIVKKALDEVLHQGGYTTNSEHYHNIHWLEGIAPESFLFRINVKGTPTITFNTSASITERVYVDPTGAADSQGHIRANYVSEEHAKRLRMNLTSSPALCGTACVD